MRRQYDGYWFPSSIQNAIITPETEFDYLHFAGGEIVTASQDPGGRQADDAPSDDGTVTVRWPRLDLTDWKRVITRLKENQKRVYGQGWHLRLPQAMHQMRDIWADRTNLLRQNVLEALTSCTGHSMGMLDFALNLLDLVSIEDLQQAASRDFRQAVKGHFVPLEGLAGRLRFFEEAKWRGMLSRALLRVGSYRERPWQLKPRSTDLILGYAAGNVPGTGLLLILLGLSAAAREEAQPPMIIVKNSRREPLFTPLVLTALETIDPALVQTTLVTMWDYTDASLQEYLVGQADLVVAAASDETIHDIGRVVEQVSTRSHPIRFHPHGHKVSFSTVGRECLEIGRKGPENEGPLVEVVALLASLDVALWNQQGCLSSRVHFVEEGGPETHHSPEEYGKAVVKSLRALNEWMPKGISKRRQIHNLFDKYQAIAIGGAVQVLSDYDDNFLVVLDRRPLTVERFHEDVNDCQGRTVVLIPVSDVLQVPDHYLHMIDPQNLQSMSVALGSVDNPGLDPRLLRYAEAVGAAGITGIRTVGRGAFPQLAYSWDGWIPRDLTTQRQEGHFTALEFDEPWAQIYETYRLVRQAAGLEDRM